MPALRCHLSKRRHPVLGRWVRREEAVVLVRVERVDDEHMGCRWIALGRVVVDSGRTGCYLLQR